MRKRRIFYINIIICKPTKNDIFFCHRQWTMDNDEIWLWVGQVQAWPMHGLPAALLTWATPGRRSPASPATPARLGCKHLDGNIYFFDQALPMRRAGVAHPWLTRGAPVDHPWTTRGPTGPCRNVPPRQRGIPCYMDARSARSA